MADRHTPAAGALPTVELTADITSRHFEPGDIDACLSLMRGRLAYPPDVLRLLPKAWLRLYAADALNAAVIEAHGPDQAPVVVGMGASVIVSDDWLSASWRGDEPYLTARTLRAEMTGRSPILRPPAIARANEDGVNVLILHYGERRELPEELLRGIRYQVYLSLVAHHRGFRVAALLQEYWDEIAPEYVINGWGSIITDFAAWFARRGQAVPPPGQGPLLVGVTSSGILAKPGDLTAPLFIYHPRRLQLTRSEQLLLRRALLGETDEQLARSLGIALSTVKTRWRGIYDRIGRVAPELVDDPGPRSTRRPARGHEKRRKLLDYLHQHPEELQLALASGRPPGGGRPRAR